MTQAINSDDIAILDSGVPVYLSWKQIRDIAEINVCPLLGFPESCYLFVFIKESLQCMRLHFLNTLLKHCAMRSPTLEHLGRTMTVKP